MSDATIEIPIQGGRRRRISLVPALCGIAVAGSWLAGCLAIVWPV